MANSAGLSTRQHFHLVNGDKTVNMAGLSPDVLIIRSKINTFPPSIITFSRRNWLQGLVKSYSAGPLSYFCFCRGITDKIFIPTCTITIYAERTSPAYLYSLTKEDWKLLSFLLGRSQQTGPVNNVSNHGSSISERSVKLCWIFFWFLCLL
jgi:hypothetical protein